MKFWDFRWWQNLRGRLGTVLGFKGLRSQMNGLWGASRW